MKIRPKILPNLDFGKSELRCFTPCHMSIMSRTVKHEVVISQTLTQRILGPLNTKALEISVSIHQRMVAGGSKKSNLCNSLRHSFSHMMEQHRMTCMSWHFWRAGPHKRNKFVRMQTWLSTSISTWSDMMDAIPAATDSDDAMFGRLGEHHGRSDFPYTPVVPSFRL